MTEYALLHIPRTGGAARLFTVSNSPGIIRLCDHPVRQSDLADGVVAIVYVRHPVERFRSLWAYVQGRLDEVALRPATWWLDGDPARREVYATETMDRTWPRLMERLGVPAYPLPKSGDAGRNERVRDYPRLSGAAVDALVARYADDLAIWEAAS